MRPPSFASRALIWTTLGMCAVALLATTSDAADTAGTTTAFITFKDRATDVVGYGRPAKGPDGRPDAHFTITVTTTAARTTTAIELLGAGLNSTTDPKNVTSNELAVLRSGKRLNPGDGGLTDQLPPGTTVYDVYSADAAQVYQNDAQVKLAYAMIRFTEANAPVAAIYRSAALVKTPLSEARLDGTFDVKITVVNGEQLGAAGNVLKGKWVFTPGCTTGACGGVVRVDLQAFALPRVALNLAGTRYSAGQYLRNWRLLCGEPPGIAGGAILLFSSHPVISGAKLLSGETRATAIKGTGFLRIAPTPAGIAGAKLAGVPACAKPKVTNVTFVGTRRGS